MSEIQWLDVVVDYTKRFPYITYKDLFGTDMYNFKLSELYHTYNSDNSYFLCTKTFGNVFSTSDLYGEGYLEVFRFKPYGWTKVPDNVLLRLLTEGKEDLI